MAQRESGDFLRWIPLGGLGEIGLNCMVLESQGEALVIDAGSMFPEEHMRGVDLVVPDVSYLEESPNRIAGLILTHGHEDHIGALPFILPRVGEITLYGTPLTLALVEEKLLEHKVEPLPRFEEIQPGERVSIGPFDLEFIRVCHSISDGVAVAIGTPQGVILHTGDFKFDASPVGEPPMDIQAFSRYGERGVLCLLSDSTNVERPGYSVSETQIQKNLSEIVRQCPGRVIISTFSSNIQRIREVVQLALQHDRKLLIHGRSMATAVRLAQDTGHLEIPRDLLVDISELSHIQDHEVMILTTGSQGEPLSALSLMANDRHKWLKIRPGDTVIFSSRFIPGNESAIYRIINELYRRGAKVFYEPLAQVHVSGHASREELKLMLQLTRPRFFVPIHGEYRHLVQHIELAQEVALGGIKPVLAQNGEVYRLTAHSMTLDGTIPHGRVYVDGKGVGDVGEAVLRDRRHLSEDGLVVVMVVFEKDSGEIISGPELFSKGFAFEEEEARMMAEAKEVVQNALQHILHCPEGEPTEDLEAGLRRVLRSHFWRTIRRRPMIMPLIVEV
jgi:ribonuclease J